MKPWKWCVQCAFDKRMETETHVFYMKQIFSLCPPISFFILVNSRANPGNILEFHAKINDGSTENIDFKCVHFYGTIQQYYLNKIITNIL